MAKNKHKKKGSALSVSQSDSEQAQSLFEQYHEIAQALHGSSDQQQAEIALESVTGEPETVQMALLKQLARTSDAEAADVLLALNTLSPLKEVRKEARRGLIQLEQSKTYPSWQPPVERKPAFLSIQEAESGNPPRFWKGYMNGSRADGEANILLMWEQGEEYRDVRTIGLLLEFWSEGVKDFFTFVESKRKAQKEIDRNTQAGQFVPCSLAKAKRLIQEALAANEKTHTSPHVDYRLNVSLVNQLILEAPDIGEEELEEIDEADEDDTDLFDLTQLTPTDVIINFVEAWVDEDYELAYDLLADTSPLRGGLSQEDWVNRREKWAEEAQPEWLLPGFVREHESPASGIWLPNPRKRRPSNTLELEAGWSVELSNAAVVEALPELATPTLVYQETGRRWFWITYSLVQEEVRWRIHSIADEGANLRALPTAQITKRIGNIENEANKIVKKSPPKRADSPEKIMGDISGVISLMNTTLFFQDILLTKPDVGEEAIKLSYQTALALSDYERCIAYLDVLMERFPEQRAQTLQIRAATQMQLIARYSEEVEEGDEDEESDEEVDDERITRLEELAEADLRESLRIKNTLEGHLLLGQFLYESNDHERFDEAEAQLNEAQAMGVNEAQTELIEYTLGSISYERERFDQALVHYQRVAEIDPQRENIWHMIGDSQIQLEQTAVAEASFKKELELHPANMAVYGHLVKLYSESERFDEARELLEHGLIENPDSPRLLALLSSVYFETGEIEQAEELLQEAEEIDADSPTVLAMRHVLETQKQKQIEQ